MTDYGTGGDVETGFQGESEQLNGTRLNDSLDIQIRHGFIRKVFSILGAQLVTTAMIAVPFVTNADATKVWLRNNPAVPVIALIGLISVMMVMCCCSNLMRQFPYNYLILGGFTICEGLLVGMATIQFTTNSVLIVVGITAVVVCSLIAFAFQTKYDFTGYGPYLMVALLVMILMGFIMMFFSTPFLHTLYSAFGAMLFSFYIVYDTQLIVGGKNAQYSFSVDDYCLAALNIYMDIIQLFLYLLQLFGDRRD